MATIVKLSEEVINRIAAGEVVQRPSSALKELLENSIDAGATRVGVACADGGMQQLIISDDGHGINKDDLPLLCERFATSKLKVFSDLQSINTFGFRGEALASISHVARVTVTTKTKSSPHAFTAKYLDGKLVEGPTPCAGTDGTVLRVDDLFYNSAVRKTALSKTAQEYAKIVDVVSKYSLAFPQVAFTCKKTTATSLDCNFPKESNLLSNVRLLYGQSVSNRLHKFEYTSPDNTFTFYGVASDLAYTSKKNTFILFTNNRLVDSNALRQGVDQAYAPVLVGGAKPFVALFLKVLPSRVDVNVHPTKHQVFMMDEDIIAARVFDEIGKVLQNTGGGIGKSGSATQNGGGKKLDPQVQNMKPISQGTFFSAKAASIQTNAAGIAVAPSTINRSEVQRGDMLKYLKPNINMTQQHITQQGGALTVPATTTTTTQQQLSPTQQQLPPPPSSTVVIDCDEDSMPAPGLASNITAETNANNKRKRGEEDPALGSARTIGQRAKLQEEQLRGQFSAANKNAIDGGNEEDASSDSIGADEDDQSNIGDTYDSTSADDDEEEEEEDEEAAKEKKVDVKESSSPTTQQRNSLTLAMLLGEEKPDTWKKQQSSSSAAIVPADEEHDGDEAPKVKSVVILPPQSTAVAAPTSSVGGVVGRQSSDVDPNDNDAVGVLAGGGGSSAFLPFATTDNGDDEEEEDDMMLEFKRTRLEAVKVDEECASSGEDDDEEEVDHDHEHGPNCGAHCSHGRPLGPDGTYNLVEKEPVNEPPVEYVSDPKLLLETVKEIKKQLHLSVESSPAVVSTFNNIVYIGILNERFAVFQSGTSLLVGDINKLAHHAVYQRCFFCWGKQKVAKLVSPVSIRELLTVAVTAMARAGNTTVLRRGIPTLVESALKKIKQWSDMYSLYYGMEFEKATATTTEENADLLLTAMPLPMGEYWPLDSSRLPDFFLRLACDVDYTSEGTCFKGVAEEIAYLFDTPKLPPLDGLRSADDSATTQQEPVDSSNLPSLKDAPIELVNAVRFALVPSISSANCFVAQSTYASDGCLKVLVTVEELYKVFERC